MKSWFSLFLLKSISQRKSRVVIASLSVMLAVAVITAMIAVTSGIGEKLGQELKAYGANMVVSSATGGYLDEAAAHLIADIKNVEGVAGQLFGNAQLKGQPVEVVGLDFVAVKDRGWRLTGNWPVRTGEILAGTHLKDALKTTEGAVITLSYGGREKDFTVSGFIETGGSEDSAVIIDKEGAMELFGQHGKLSALLVRGRSGELEGILSEIRQALPGASVKTLHQVARAEESLLKKMQLLMVLVTLVVLFAAAVSITSTMGANVLERREEIGLMKAIGAKRKEIGRFYVSESFLIGLTGGIAGLIAGFLSAQAVSKTAFGSFISMPWYLPFVSLAIGIILSILAGHFPVRDALKYRPAEILRGE